MARYTERAENTARMLDVNLQTSLLPQSESSAELLWRGILASASCSRNTKRASRARAAGRSRFHGGDPSNPSSITLPQCARENARAVRARSRRSMGDDNSTWLE